MSTETTNTRNRGFASMNAEKQREIARKGGRAAHEKGTAHEFTSDEARAAGRSSAGRRAARSTEPGEQSGPDVGLESSTPGSEVMMQPMSVSQPSQPAAADENDA